MTIYNLQQSSADVYLSLHLWRHVTGCHAVRNSPSVDSFKTALKTFLFIFIANI